METWKKLGEEVIRAGYRKVIKQIFEAPAGQQMDFDVVEEGRVVCILALTKDNQVILAKQFRPGPERVLLELPGGGIKSDEDPIAGATRELLEETGYKGDMRFVTESLHSAYSTMRRYNFVATNCEKVAEPSNDDGEFTEVVLMPLAQFREHLRSGQLTDMGTGYRALDFLNLL